MVTVVNRIFSTATVLLYAVVGVMCYQIYFKQPHYLELNYKILNYSNKINISKYNSIKIEKPNLDFNNNQNIPSNIEKVTNNKTTNKKKFKDKIIWRKISRSIHLNFMDPLIVKTIIDNHELPKNLVAYFNELNIQTTEIDSLKIKLSKNREINIDDKEELEFYEYSNSYPQENVDKVVKNVKAVDNSKEIVEAVDNSKKIVEAVDNSKKIVEAVDNSKKNVEEVEYLNIAEAVDNSEEIVEAVDNSKNIVEAVDNSKINVEILAHNVQMTTQNNIGTNLKETFELVGFDLTLNDTSETISDFNSGVILLNESIHHKSANRNISLNRNGYVSTHIDLTYENALTEITIPTIDSETFNNLMIPYESKGIYGALLIELDDETEKVKIDVPFGRVIKLDEKLKETNEDNNRYVIYLGVQAGNALVEFSDRDGKKVSKIVHIHENELVFDPNIYEKGSVENIELYEEDLLSKEPSKLIIPSDSLVKFATNESGIKLNDNTYKMNYEKNLLGSRNYVELNHLNEPIFVGYKSTNKLLLPTENLIRHVLSSVSGNNLQSRCVIQVNLSEPITEAMVGIESVENNTTTYTQYLDQDGKFYDSPGSKTSKMIIVGEMNSIQGINPDSKINLKLLHKNNSVTFLGTYCSPTIGLFLKISLKVSL